MISDIAYWHYLFRWFHAWIRCIGKWPLREKEETEYHEECIYTAVYTANALQSIHLFQSLLHCIAVFFRPLTRACKYIDLRYHSRSISNRYGSLLSALAMGLNTPLGVTVRPTYGKETGHHVAATSLCIACDLHGSNVANEALNNEPVLSSVVLGPIFHNPTSRIPISQHRTLIWFDLNLYVVST